MEASIKPKSDTLIALFSHIARPIMRQFFPANSCIESAIVTHHVFQAFKVPVEYRSVKLALELTERSFAYSSGLGDEELDAIKNKVHTPWDGWRGHLVNVVAGNYLVDSAIDQAQEAVLARIGVDLGLEGKVMVLPFEQGIGELFLIDVDATTDSNERIRLRYATNPDNTGYMQSDAWNMRKMLGPFARIIAAKMVEAYLCEDHGIMT